MKVAAMVWIFVSPAPQIRYWNPNPIVMVLESGAFGRCLGDEDEGVMKGMSALIKETPPELLATLAVWRHGEKPLLTRRRTLPRR